MLCLVMQRHQSNYAKILQKEKEKEKENPKTGMFMPPSDPRQTGALPPPGQRPRHAHDHFALAETPEVNAHADYIVEPRVRALVQQQRRQAAQWVDEQAGFDAAMHRRQCGRDPGGRSRGEGGVGGGDVFASVVLGRVVVRGGGVAGGGGGVVVV